MTVAYSLETAFKDWRDGDLYLGNDGHYRLKSNKGRIAPYSRAIKYFYPDNFDFHRRSHQPGVRP